MPPQPLRIDEDQALWFRARRSHLARGAASPVAVARALIGAQAQQESSALYALSLRVTRRPTAAALRDLLVRAQPALVRTWGQRDTLHVYDPADWRSVVAAIAAWPLSGRRSGLPSAKLLSAARRRFRRATRPLLRTDLFSLLPADYLAELASHPGVGDSAERLAASRLIWILAKQGEVCFADKTGSEVRYAPRHLAFPDLDWPDVATADAVGDLTRRYLATFGPATASDAAHFFGARVTQMRTTFEELAEELVAVECGERDGLVALLRDRRTLATSPPTDERWPTRLLPQWDTHLMTHRDKTWVVPRGEELPLVWRKAAVVAASVIDRGRVVATWRHKARRRIVTVTVSPLGDWREAHLPAVERDATELARHLGIEKAEVVLA